MGPSSYMQSVVDRKSLCGAYLYNVGNGMRDRTTRDDLLTLGTRKLSKKKITGFVEDGLL